MSEVTSRLGEISATLSRIEGKLDTVSTQFEGHIVEDRIVAAEVLKLARNQQRGFVSVASTVALAIGAAVGGVLHRIIGRT